MALVSAGLWAGRVWVSLCESSALWAKDDSSWIRALARAPDLGALELLATHEPERLAPVRLRIRDLFRELERARRHVQDGETVRSEALATLAHELKTPLTAIRGYSKLMAEGDGGPVTAQQLEYLSIIQESVSRVVKIADEVLEGARDSMGGVCPVLERFEFRSLLKELEQTARVLVPSHLALNFDTSALPENIWVRGNRLHLFQAFLNLVTNALKYTERGEIQVVGRVDLDESVPPRLSVTVRDTGIGIPSEEQARIFERFYRAERARELGLPGLGLGLAMTRQWVEEANGWISLWSREGVGSEFKVELPCEVL